MTYTNDDISKKDELKKKQKRKAKQRRKASKKRNKKKYKKKRNFKMPPLTYMSDAFYKFTICRDNDSRCVKLRNFYIKNIIGFQIDNLRVTSPEMIPRHVLQMKALMDCLLENEDYMIDLEMENHKLDLYTRNRIEVYGADALSQAQIKGDNYANARIVITIFIINDSFDESNQLIEKMCTGTERSDNHFTLGQQCHFKFFVQLPMIDKIAKEKEVLSEFEALMYLIRHQNLEGIKYEEKEGMITMVQEMKEEFERETPQLYKAAVKREAKLRTINFEAFAESQAKEIVRRKAKKEAERKANKKIQAMQEENDKRIKVIQEESELKAKETIAKEKQRNIDKGEKQGKKMILIEMCNKLLENNYEGKDNNWLNSCTIEQLRKVFELTQEKEKCSYKDLMETIFSTSKGAYAAGR